MVCRADKQPSYAGWLWRVQIRKTKTMKKLMILAAAVVASVAANAAAITWGSGTVYLADGTTKAGKDVVTAYLFLVDSSTYGTLAANTTGKAMSDAVYAAYGSSLGSAAANKGTTAKGVANIADPTVYANGSTAYAVILYVEGDNYMGNVATYTLTSDLDATVGSLSVVLGGDVGGGSTATAWSSVPEPTSGLLMLLGMAGLALRRRRA
jgi:hypothetical protein